MYPYVMQKYEYPTKLLRIDTQTALTSFYSYREKYAYIVDATLDMRRNVLPSSKEGNIVYATGIIRGVYTKPELERALQFGSLLAVHRIALYKVEKIFAEYVSFFYEARQKFKKEGNQAFAYVSKLMLNSLYGKFGQKITTWKKIGTTTKHTNGYYKCFDTRAKEVMKLRIIDGIVERSNGYEEGADSFVAIASFVTAYARVYLDELIERAGSRNVLYCDTDSLFLTAEGYHNLAAFMDENELGKLKLVGISSDVEIYAPKWYRFGEVTKCKGIRKDAEIIDERTFSQDRFQSFNGALEAQNTDGVIITKVHKHLNTVYKKGIVLPDGFVKPFTV